MRYSVKENTQLQRTQNSDYVIKPSQTVNLFSKLVIISKRRRVGTKFPLPTRGKTMYITDHWFCKALVKIRYIILYLGAAERRSESEKII